MLKKKLLILLLIFFINKTLYSKSKEAVLYMASSFVMQKDSLSEEYSKAKKLYDLKKYASSLKVALKLIEEDNKSSNKELIFTNYLIANIFFSSRSNNDAIKY